MNKRYKPGVAIPTSRVVIQRYLELINRRSKTTEIPFLNAENKICSEPIEKVKALNNIFIKTEENLSKKFQGQNPYLQVSDKIPNTVSEFRFGFITEKAVT